MIMGAGYIAGAYFFARVVMEPRFHRVHVGFLPVTAFTIFMAVGSFAHLDRFLQDHVAFWIWMGLYVTTPILVPLAWLANRRTDPGTPEPGETRLLRGVAERCSASGAFQSLVALALLLSPSTMIDVWPWALTPLTAQTLGGWFALPGHHGDHDGARRAPERDPHHAAEPGHRPRADPRRGRARRGQPSTPRTRWRTSSSPASLRYLSACSRSTPTCGEARRTELPSGKLRRLCAG